MSAYRILLSPDAAPSAPAAAAPVDNGVRSTPNLNDAFANLDKMFNDEPTPADDKPTTEPTPKIDDVSNPDDAPLDTAPAKPAANPDVKPKDDDTKPAPAKPQKAASLREAYDRMKSDLADREKRLAEYQEKEKLWKPNDEEKKQWEEKLTVTEKRRQELEEHIKYVDYSKSAEYQEKYVKPFNEAYQAGQETAAQFKVVNGDTGEERQATTADFDEIMNISDPDAAAAKIEQLFGIGVKAQNVSQARNDVLKAYKARQSALNEFKVKGAEFEKQRFEQTRKQREEVVKNWGESVKNGQERLPQLFKPTDGADDENAALETGYRLADLAFGALPQSEYDKLPDFVKSDLVNGGLTPLAKIKLDAAIRNKAGAFDRVAMVNRKLSKKVAELEKRLEGFKSSEPGSGTDRTHAKDPANAGFGDIDAAIDRMARR